MTDERTADAIEAYEGLGILGLDWRITLAYLILKGVVYVIRRYFFKKTHVVNVEDAFTPGAKDELTLEKSDVLDLYRLYKSDPTWGAVRWACLHRNQHPRAEVEQAMRAAGSWDGALEALPPNEYEKRLREDRDRA